MNILMLLHLLGVVVWVGGMFFAYMALRPAAVETLEPPQRLTLWRATFHRFFPWVWVSVALILVTGLMMIAQFGGIGAMPAYVHAMFAIGVIMMMIFGHVYFASFKKLKRGVVAQDWKAAGAALSQIRMLISINLSLGLINVFLVFIGRQFT
jgi:uncharacterized membrane protein